MSGSAMQVLREFIVNANRSVPTAAPIKSITVSDDFSKRLTWEAGKMGLRPDPSRPVKFMEFMGVIIEVDPCA